jgi:hypothetical protein
MGHERLPWHRLAMVGIGSRAADLAMSAVRQLCPAQQSCPLLADTSELCHFQTFARSYRACHPVR